MADAVTVRKLYDSKTKAGFLLTNISDGSGETNATKITANTLVGFTDGATHNFAVDRLTWSVQSGAVHLEFSANSDMIAVLSGNGSWGANAGLANIVPIDPITQSANNNLLVTTDNFGANSTYTIFVGVTKTTGYDLTNNPQP